MGNDFWAWEQTPGHVADNSNSGLACDWWNRAEEDFDRAAALGLNTLRLSLEWSRIEPRPGIWNDAAFDHYRAALHHAIQCGVDVRGYYYWTLVDNYEWTEGWTTPFGLFELEPTTQVRTSRRSATLYSAIVRANAVT